MSTHATVGYLREGELLSVYVHSDGYFSWLGKMLQEHYADKEKAFALVSLGDISMVYERLAPDPGEEHSFAHPVIGMNGKPGITRAYHRDRGEPFRITRNRVDNFDEACQALSEENEFYQYLFDENTSLWFGSKYNSSKFRPLKEVLANLEPGD